MTPSYTQPTPAAEKPVEFAVGQRQLAAIGFVCFLVLGLVSTMAYLAGRVTSGPAATAAAATAPVKIEAKAAVVQQPPAPPPQANKPAVEQLIVVDAPAKPVPAPAAAPPVAAPPVATVAPATVRRPSSPAEPTPVEKLKGNTYLQVAAIDRAMAEVTHRQLSDKGLPVLIGDSPSEGIYRVLVGPIRDAAEIPAHQAALNEAGFQPFVKKY